MLRKLLPLFFALLPTLVYAQGGVMPVSLTFDGQSVSSGNPLPVTTSGGATVASSGGASPVVITYNGQLVSGSNPLPVSNAGGSPPTGPAGGALKGTYPNPLLADVNSIATSLAIGGATIGTDALGVTGTATFSGIVATAGVNVTGSGIPANGIYLASANTIGFSTSTTARLSLSTTAINFGLPLVPTGVGGARILASGASSTVPSVVPNNSDTTTGMGAQAAGNISLIAGGTEVQRVTSTGVTVNQALSVTSGGVMLSGANANFVAGGNGLISWTANSAMKSPVNGTIMLGNNNFTAFTLLVLGNNTSSFPALKVNGSNIDFRVGDDTAYSSIRVLGLTVQQTPTTITQATTMTFSSAADSATNIGHRCSFNMNGTTYWFPCSSVAF